MGKHSADLNDIESSMLINQVFSVDWYYSAVGPPHWFLTLRVRVYLKSQPLNFGAEL
jgi:hypothetical protein